MLPLGRSVCVSLLVILQFLLPSTLAEVVQLDQSNVDTILAGSDVVFVQFYADWCRFSQQLKPIFAEASEKFKDTPQSKIVWAAVDSDRQPDIAARYHVNKYPTLKLFRNGELVKKEYRGQRSVAALSEFVQKQLDGSINEFTNNNDLQTKINKEKRNVIGFFPPAATGAALENFKKVASVLREECAFWLSTSAENADVTQQGPRIVFQAANSQEQQQFTSDANNLDFLKPWLTDKCIPLVREITFENAEELTEEGLPFLILFKKAEDTESEKVFTDAVVREIPDQKTAVNCLVADGRKFAHPLHHLGKSEGDLPVIAIDSFRHMYLFSSYEDLKAPGKLRTFVMDLHSGKLHREFHHGPDPTNPQQPAVPGETQPPPSVFNKLKPSDNRYTLLTRDEL